MQNSNDTIGNRTREFPACSAVPEPSALPRAYIHTLYFIRIIQGADKSLARPGRKQGTATEDFEFHISCFGLGVACWPLVPKFAGSNPAEAVGFLKKFSARLPSEGN